MSEQRQIKIIKKADIETHPLYPYVFHNANSVVIDLARIIYRESKMPPPDVVKIVDEYGR